MLLEIHKLNKLESPLIRQLDSLSRRTASDRASTENLVWHYDNHLAGDNHNRAARRRRGLFPHPVEGDVTAWCVLLAATKQTVVEVRLVVNLQEEWNRINSECLLDQYQQKIAALQLQLYTSDGHLQARTATQIRALNPRIEKFRSRLNLLADRTRYFETRVVYYDQRLVPAREELQRLVERQEQRST